MKNDTNRREPGHPLFWLFVFALLFVVVPFLFAGRSEPRLWGLPLWLFVSVGASALITLASAWRIWRHWELEPDTLSDADSAREERE